MNPMGAVFVALGMPGLMNVFDGCDDQSKPYKHKEVKVDKVPTGHVGELVNIILDNRSNIVSSYMVQSNIPSFNY